MAFPDERDRNLIRAAEQVETLATDLCDWLSEFNPARRATLGQAACEFVAAWFDWATIVPRLEKVYGSKVRLKTP